ADKLSVLELGGAKPRLGARKAIVFSGQRLCCAISHPFDCGDAFGTDAPQHKFVLGNHQGLLEQQWVGIAIADGLRHALDIREELRVMTRDGCQSVPQRIAAGAGFACCRSWSAALSAIAPARRTAALRDRSNRDPTAQAHGARAPALR